MTRSHAFDPMCGCDACYRHRQPTQARRGPSPVPARTGPKPRAGVTSSETLRFRCSPGERAEIEAACCAAGRDLSDVVRELLLAWARRHDR